MHPQPSGPLTLTPIQLLRAILVINPVTTVIATLNTTIHSSIPPMANRIIPRIGHRIIKRTTPLIKRLKSNSMTLEHVPLYHKSIT